MSPRTILSALTLFGTALASADHNWFLESTYTYALTANVGTAFIRDLEFKMDGDFADPAQGGWGVSTSFFNHSDGNENNNANTLGVGFDTYPFYGRDSSQPILRRSLFFGIIQGLPQDIEDGNAAQKHLVLFIDPASAENIKERVFGVTFPTTKEDALIEALEQVHRDDLTDAQKKPFYENEIYPFYDAASDALAGANPTPQRSVYFGAGSDFDIVFFSDGQIVGTGTNTFTTSLTPVPEPASFAALGFGALALLRRRRR